MDILKDLEFEVKDRVFLKLSPWKGVVRFGKRGKLNHRYIELFEIVERIGPVAYRLELPEEFSRVHNVFHISMLRKYIPNSSHVLETLEIELKELRNKTISLVKVLWRNHLVEEATCWTKVMVLMSSWSLGISIDMWFVNFGRRLDSFPFLGCFG